jgi:hypothetical protein
MRLKWITVGVALALIAAVVRYYVVWERGDDIRVPGYGTVRRFACANYYVPDPSTLYQTIQAFAALEGAATAAQSNTKSAVRTLVDAVFDREMPGIRCGNPLRRRVFDAEWQFRNGTKRPITEQVFTDAANEILTANQAPPSARTSVGEAHSIRGGLRDELPRLVGTVDSQREVSDKMTPVEAVFLLMTIGRGMLFEPEEFSDGPDAYIAHLRELQLNPPEPKVVMRARVMAKTTADLGDGESFNDPDAQAASSANRLLDRLGFQP